MNANIPIDPESKNIRRVESETIDWLRSVRKKRMTKEQLDHGDRRIQNECYKDFESFSKLAQTLPRIILCLERLSTARNVQNLNHGFDAFMKAIRPFGSSNGLINTSKKLQNGLYNVLQAFRSNSAETWREFSLGVGSNELPRSLVGSSAEPAPGRLDLANTMKILSILLSDFLKGLNEIPEFSDKPLADSLMEFQTWLDCRAERIMSHELWMSVCLDQAPLVCLAGAVLTFSLGLVIWTIAFDLALPVKICAAVITSATFVVLFTVGLWEIKEWLTRTEWSITKPTQHTAGPQTEVQPRHSPWRDWREDDDWVLVEPSARGWLLKIWDRFVRRIRAHHTAPAPTISTPQGNLLPRSGDALPTPAGPETTTLAAEASVSGICLSSGLFEGDYEYEAPNLEERVKRFSASLPLVDPLNAAAKQRPPTAKISSARQRFQKVVLDLINDSQLREILVNMPNLPFDYNSFQLDDLQKLQPVSRLPIFHPAGQDIHFSPDGNYLGVSQLNGNVAIWRADRLYDQPEISMTSPTGRFGWSPDGSQLVVITKNGLSIRRTGSWYSGGLSKQTGLISVVAWLQSSRAFILVIDDVLHVFDTELQPRVPHAPILLPVEVHDVASIPHSSRSQYGFILVLGTLCDETPQERPESSVIDLDAVGGGRSVAEAPTLAEARHICVSKDGQHAIVSYADGSCPELWKLRDRAGKMQLLFRGRFTPMDPETTQRNGDPSPATAGKARFCGKSDEWVMATDGQSHIYIWDRYSRHLLHTLKGSQIRAKFENYSDISAVTSTVKHDRKASPIVVSACTKGGVIVWEYPAEEKMQVDSAPDGESSKARTTNLNPLQ
ncbi:hypothetical protein M407DRAFT_25304 [Tulasnella calospora MUT 4182]|uniref:Uncharacterized protein n=1 Tax=Tulasnella calospora MUT 4182 TaxID=1051891 RepID=A0A0C3QGG2_9AGAM|nr:hypothetical protein M407DRAFT_25304 [Tulasnella calospora MUT 4182]